MTYYGAPIRSPETKTEVKQAATVLFVLGVLFAVGALIGGVERLSNDGSHWMIIAAVSGGISPLLFAAGAYNIYCRMRHHPVMAKALASSMITVSAIIFFLFAVIFGGIAILIYF